MSPNRAAARALTLQRPLSCRPTTTHPLSPHAIQQILAWHARRVAFRRSQGTLTKLAAQLHVGVHALKALARASKPSPTSRTPRARRIAPPPRHRVGRPRVLSGVQIRTVIHWYRRYDAFRRDEETAAQLARRLDVSVRTLYVCIRRGGRYRPRCGGPVATGKISMHERAPQRRALRRRQKLEEERTQRSSLLQGWGAPTMSVAAAQTRRETHRGRRPHIRPP